MEHYPFIALNDDTAITFSDVKDNGNGEYVTIYFETPVEGGFNSMQVNFPFGIPEKIVGYTNKEISCLMEHYRKIAKLSFEFAKEG